MLPLLAVFIVRDRRKLQILALLCTAHYFGLYKIRSLTSLASPRQDRPLSSQHRQHAFRKSRAHRRASRLLEHTTNTAMSRCKMLRIVVLKRKLLTRGFFTDQVGQELRLLQVSIHSILR